MFVLLALVKLNSLKLVVPVCFSENTERAGNSEGEPQFSHPISLSLSFSPKSVFTRTSITFPDKSFSWTYKQSMRNFPAVHFTFINYQGLETLVKPPLILSPCALRHRSMPTQSIRWKWSSWQNGTIAFRSDNQVLFFLAQCTWWFGAALNTVEMWTSFFIFVALCVSLVIQKCQVSFSDSPHKQGICVSVNF